jgi:hypothetical protein
MTANDHVFEGPELRTIGHVAATTRLSGMLHVATGALLVIGFVVLQFRHVGSAFGTTALVIAPGAGATALVTGLWMLRAASTLRRIAGGPTDHTTLLMDAFARLARVYRTQLRALLLLAAVAVAILLTAGHG